MNIELIGVVANDANNHKNKTIYINIILLRYKSSLPCLCFTHSLTHDNHNIPVSPAQHKQACKPQRPRIDLNTRFLPRPNTTTA